MSMLKSLLSLLMPQKEKTLRENAEPYMQEGKDYGYGLREDKTQKGRGYFGEMQMQDKSGKVFGEMSLTSTLDGEEILYPSVVPTLTREELDIMARDEEWPESIFTKALNFAMERKKQGLPFFALPEEEGKTPIPEYLKTK